jgi:aldehyde:ferredoxin oxidoreductase
MDITKMKENHKVLAEYKYEPGQIDKGYTNRTLYVNISDNTISSKPVTQMMKEKFVGGKNEKNQKVLKPIACFIDDCFNG